MAMKTVQYAATGQDQSRGPSMAVWRDFPAEDAQQSRSGGLGTIATEFWDDFYDVPAGSALFNGERQVGQWSVWLGNNAGVLLGTAADTTNLPMEGGVLGMTAGANNNLSITLAPTGGPGFRLISPASGFPFGQKLWFEASVAVGSIASGAMDFFVGLMDTGEATGTRITSAADLVFSAANTIKTATGNGGCIGFWKRATTNPSDFAVVYNVNNGTAQTPGSATNLQKLSLNYGPAGGQALTALSSTNNIAAANTFIKLGFIFDPTNSATVANAPAAITSNQTSGQPYLQRVRFYVNGQLAGAFLNSSDVQASTFPQTFMAPVIGWRSGGTGITAGIGYIDWIRVGQLSSF